MSRERRFYVPDLDTRPLELPRDEAHHLVHVLRLREGDVVALFDGRGRAASASVAAIAGDTVTLELGQPLPANESPLALTMAVAVPKGDTMALIVQKLTELGVATIQPLISEHSEMPPEAIEKRLDRWRRVALEAAKQCGRSRLPSLARARLFDEVVAESSWLLTPDGAPLKTAGFASAVVLIGPEGGWSSAELDLARRRGARPFCLGPRTMRTETAAIAAAALVQSRLGDLG